MKGKERAQLIQIANVSFADPSIWSRIANLSQFESDIAALQRSLESSKASYGNMQRLYNDQCGA